MDPGPQDLAPHNDEINACNLLGRLIAPDQPSKGHLILGTICFLCALGLTVDNFRHLASPQPPLSNTLYGTFAFATTLLAALLGYIVANCAWKFSLADPRVEQGMAGIGPPPVPIEAPDLETQLRQGNDEQVPIHINDEAHHAGTAGVNAVAPQHEYEVQFPRGITSLGRDGPTFHPSWSYAQDIRSDESNSRDGRHSQGSSPSSNSHNSISPGRAGPSQPFAHFQRNRR
ncbi:hypothetical protein SeMB42_g00192 [Synchytrium endobioticum]|uniref:Uncharacterized protein n=1 Tax=Synchytrium endobioticum TaxID=286115 RepID=A0A507DSU8_9FUNG|nr:hypothetical protein SeLEV6574_g06552 [Synchytrium endobioticum]TPX54616.1 hypothetical protein SeMB42_g00192 [Synchytrium endobioticum]